MTALSMFAVYILHQYPWGSKAIWEYFGIQKAYEESWWIGHLLLVSIIILIVAVLIDLARRMMWKQFQNMPSAQKIKAKICDIDSKYLDITSLNE